METKRTKLTPKELRKLAPTDDKYLKAYIRRHNKSYVYILECQGYYKIGKANDLKSRVTHFQTGNPFPITVVFSKASVFATSLEPALHELLAELRVAGEWFKLNDKALKFAKKFLNEANDKEMMRLWLKLHE